MNLLDRHIFKSVFGSCAAAVLLLAFMLMLGNVLKDLMAPMLAGQLPVTKFLSLTALLIPFAASYALPMGMLTGILLTLGRLSADNEITAMRAAGISMPRLVRPVFILAGLGAAVGLYVNFEAMPHAKVVYERDLTAAMHANPLNLIVPRTFIRQFPNYVLYIGDKQQGGLKDFWLWQLDSDHQVIRFVRAASGRVDYDEKTNQIQVVLANAQVETLDPKMPESFVRVTVHRDFRDLGPLPSVPRHHLRPHGVSRQKLAWMTYARAAQPDRDSTRRSRTRMETLRSRRNEGGADDPRKNSPWPLPPSVSFALIGVPLGIRVSRRETSANLRLGE